MSASNRHELLSDSCARYMQEIRKFPILSASEERRLAHRWRDMQDSKAAELLIRSHLRLVVAIARRYQGYGLPLADLISEGNIGMMRALERFDPDRGFRLSTYASWWIRATIQEYVLKSWSLVRMTGTAQQKRLFFRLRGLKQKLQAGDSHEILPETCLEIARQTRVSKKDVEGMNNRLFGPDSSLNQRIVPDSEVEWQDLLVDHSKSQEDSLSDQEQSTRRHALLSKALPTLPEREQIILKARRLKEEPATLEELSRFFKISVERVRQIEVSAFRRLQTNILAADIGAA